MLTRFIKIQLVLFTVLTLIALGALGFYYLRLPALAGIGTRSRPPASPMPPAAGTSACASMT